MLQNLATQEDKRRFTRIVTKKYQIKTNFRFSITEIIVIYPKYESWGFFHFFLEILCYDFININFILKKNEIIALNTYRLKVHLKKNQFEQQETLSNNNDVFSNICLMSTFTE